jgi:hypothetical protein
MSVHDAQIDLPSLPANWTITLGSTTGQQHWPAILSRASSTQQHQWSAPLTGIIGQTPWQHVQNTLMMMMLSMLPKPRFMRKPFFLSESHNWENNVTNQPGRQNKKNIPKK